MKLKQFLSLLILPVVMAACSGGGDGSSVPNPDRFLKDLSNQHKADECPSINGSYRSGEGKSITTESLKTEKTDLGVSFSRYESLDIDGKIRSVAKSEGSTGNRVGICSKNRIIFGNDETYPIYSTEDDGSEKVFAQERIQWYETYELQKDGKVVYSRKLKLITPDYAKKAIEKEKDMMDFYNHSYALTPESN